MLASRIGLSLETCRDRFFGGLGLVLVPASLGLSPGLRHMSLGLDLSRI
jgi:hypothetical protein